MQQNYGEGAQIKLDSNLLPFLDVAVFRQLLAIQAAAASDRSVLWILLV